MWGTYWCTNVCDTVPPDFLKMIMNGRKNVVTCLQIYVTDTLNEQHTGRNNISTIQSFNQELRCLDTVKLALQLQHEQVGMDTRSKDKPAQLTLTWVWFIQDDNTVGSRFMTGLCSWIFGCKVNHHKLSTI
jgi:hypothetical protein